MAEGQFMSVWRDAVERYREATGIDINSKTILKPSSPEALERLIDEQQGKFESFRSKKATFFRILMSVSMFINVVGKWASPGATNALPASTLIFGAVATLVNTAKGLSDAYDTIIDLFATIQGFLDRLSIYVQHQLPQALQGLATELMASLLEICGLSVKFINDGRLKRYLKNILTERDQQISIVLRRLNALTDREGRLASALTYAEGARSGKILDGVDQKVDDVRLGVENIQVTNTDIQEKLGEISRIVKNTSKPENEKESAKKQDETIRKALKPELTKQQDIYDNVSRNILRGSGDWILNEQLFSGWRDEKKPILFVFGGPGSGKSYLSLKIIRYLQKLHPQGVQNPSRVSVAYFFCKDDDPMMRSFNTLLRTVAFQITQNDPVYAKHVATFSGIEDVHATQSLSTESLWKTLFKDFFNKMPSLKNTFYIVIDGLDEAFKKEREQFIRLMEDLEQDPDDDSNLKMQILFLGRPELQDEIEDLLGPIPLIEVSAKKNTSDIDEYINNSIRKSRKLSRISRQLQSEIRETLSREADGMFLWVNLMIKEIQSKDHEEQIRKTLKQLPKGLSDTLHHVLERFSDELDGDQINDLNAMLAWVTYARRPLTLGELDLILGIIDLEGTLRGRYASFFTLMRKDGKSTEDLHDSIHHVRLEYDSDDKEFDSVPAPTSQSGSHTFDYTFDDNLMNKSDPASTTIRLSHASIGDFFREASQDTPTAVGVHTNDAELRLAKYCLGLLCDVGADSWSERQSSLYEYASNFFQDHLSQIDISTIEVAEKQEIAKHLAQIFRNTGTIQNWVGQAVYIRRDWLFSRENNAAVRRWLVDEDAQIALDGEDINWVKEIVQAPLNLLKLVTEIFIKKWLAEYEWDSIQCFLFVHKFLQAIETSSSTNYLFIEAPDDSTVSADRIVHVAEWAHTWTPDIVAPLPISTRSALSTSNDVREFSAIWFGRVAAVLEGMYYIGPSTKYYLKAVDEDPTLAFALAGLGNTYLLSNSYLKAVEWLEKAREASKGPNDKDLYLSCVRKMAVLQFRLGHKNAAIDGLAEAIELDPGGHDALREYIELLEAERRVEDIVKLFESLRTEILEPTGNSRIVEFLFFFADDQLFVERLRALTRQVGLVKYMEDAYRSAIKAAKAKQIEGLRAALRSGLGFLYCRQLLNEDMAIKTWERVISDPEVATSSARYYKARASASEQLSVIYCNRAFDADDNPSVSGEYVQRLEDLTRQRAALETDFKETYSTRRETLVLGTWYHMHGREQEAKACFREHVMLAIDLLTDDRDDNDWEGYRVLANALMYAGDDVGSSSVFAHREQLMMQEKARDEASKNNSSAVVKDDSAARQQNVTSIEEGDHVALKSEIINALETKPPAVDEDGDSKKGKVNVNLEELAKTEEGAEGSDNAEEDENVKTNEKTAKRENLIEDSKITAEESENDSTPTLDQEVRIDWPGDEFGPQGRCDGPCRRPLSVAAGVHFCRYCIDVAFCDDCLELVKTNTLPFLMCSSKHTFLDCSGTPEMMKPGEIKIGENVFMMREWLGGLRRRWES